MNLHILFFSVLLACAQSYIHISKPITEEEVKCEETGSEEFSTWDWSPFENHASLPEVTKDIEPNFHLYRRGSILDHLVVLIHGFGSKKAVWAASMKEAIFENDPRENLAVLTVDWKKGASASFWDPIGSYNKAVANTRYIGLATHKLVQCLQKRGKSPNIEVHCVGHSLGAHACSFLGNALESSTGSKMFRVTGLDPAGPQFTTKLEPGTLTIYKPVNSAPRDQRLDETDANVVDIIHTDGNQWGTMRPIGDIDFYVGKSLETLGTQQAGCATGDLCDHSKSIKLFSESLKTHSTKFDEVLECQFDSEEPKVDNCRKTEAKPRFGYFYKHLPGRGRGGIFGVVDQEEEVKLKQEWGGWDEDWDEESWEDENEDSWKDEDKDSWDDEDKDSREDKEEDKTFQMETDPRDNPKKTTSASKVATSPPDESEKAKDEAGTPTTISSKSDDYVNENRLHLNTETDYHIHIGGLSLAKTDMIIISLVGAVLSFLLTFLVGCYLVRFCRKTKQPSCLPDSSEEVLLPV